MTRIDFTVKQTKLAQDETANVPDEIVEQGEEAIKNYLWEKGKIDTALDYAETTTEVKPIYKKK